jgi:hypothetical protein
MERTPCAWYVYTSYFHFRLVFLNGFLESKNPTNNPTIPAICTQMGLDNPSKATSISTSVNITETTLLYVTLVKNNIKNIGIIKDKKISIK